ncbi:TPA: ankyrin repeat domain-containing protein [Pseudomonas aeruginosa]|nr:ankyrin repeat domain-containing protein [Pseudomonas aeruginosa]
MPDFFEHQIDSVHYRNGWGDSPLHVVSCWGDCEAIRVLVTAGADINLPGETGFTPLHCAVEQDHSGAVALLSNSVPKSSRMPMGKHLLIWQFR